LSRQGWANVARTVAGVLVLTMMVELIGRSEIFGQSWPPLSRVAEEYGNADTRSTLSYAFGASIPEAVQGLAWGFAIGFLLAAIGCLLPRMDIGLSSAAAAIHAIPIIVIAPVLVSTVDREHVPMYMAVLASMFVAYVAAHRGLHSARIAHEDVFTALGAHGFARLARLRVMAAVPLLLEGLRLSFTAAMLGAVLGEWFGSSRGVGVVLVTSMQNGNVELLWAAALATSLVTLAGYGAVLLVELPARKRFLG
jgi:ABC-type nitrate/sulfonate/bicarbonate transport system permease component